MIDRLVEAGLSFQHPAVLNDLDVDRLLVIERNAFPIDFYNREQLLEEYLADPRMFIVARDREVMSVGYVSGDIKESIGSIVSVAVDPSLRGQGIGSCLTRLMMDHLTNCGVKLIEAHTREDNKGSIRLLGNFGFVIQNRVESYYRDGSSALLLRARL